jgi:peptidoglycan-associated lipoprotein
MNRGINSRSAVLTMILILALGLTFVGCGGKSDVETEPVVVPAGDSVEEVPEEIVPEEVKPEKVIPDFNSMLPSEYGIEDVFFTFDKFELDNESMAILSKNARIIRETGVTIVIEGHCDERGTVQYNLALGQKRADVVRDYLMSLGVSRANLRTTSYGENKPFTSGSNESAWAMNRRGHFSRP